MRKSNYCLIKKGVLQFELMNLGKQQLLQWINQQLQTQYTSVEALSDGVAYAQILDAIHPGSISIFRLNLSTRYPEDNYRNIKLVQDALKKLKIGQPFSFQKMSKGKFHENIVFLQWLYGYANRNGLPNLQAYLAFEKRLQIIQRQGKASAYMNPHLKPNAAYYQEQQWQAGVDAEEEVNVDEYGDYRQQIKGQLMNIQEYVQSLQIDLKQKMESNWSMMHHVDKTIQQRNSLYALLETIAKTVQQTSDSPLKRNILDILYSKPVQYE